MVIVLSAGQRFRLGGWMREDGYGFLKLNVGSVTLLGAGSGATLDAEQLGRMFYVTAGNLSLVNLHLVNGLAKARTASHTLTPR